MKDRLRHDESVSEISMDSEKMHISTRFMPASVSGRHVVRGRQSSPTLEVRLGEQARLVKTVKIQVRWAAAQPGQDRRLPSVVTHSRL